MDVADELGVSGNSTCSSSSSEDVALIKEDSGDMTFGISKYSKEVLKMMFMMRSHHMLTDVMLEVGKEIFHAHKVVLSAASPYFKAMFTGGLKETEMSRVKLQGICPTAMGQMMYFMYTGHIRVTEVTVCQLLPAATMFQVSHVIDACCAFLESQLDPTNAIGISNFAEQHNCDSLKQKAIQFIERHFTQICQEEEFLQLSAIQLIQLIRKDELNVQGEREVYNAVLKWVKYDEDNRYPKMEHILYAVRCQFLTPSFLKEQMRNCDVLRKVPACREYLARIFKDLTLHKKPVVQERRPNTTRMIFVAGGYFKGSLDVVEAFNVDDKTWTTLPQLRVPRSGLGAAFLKGTFYAVGGRNNTPGSSYDSDWVDRYNPVTEQWRPCAPMTVPRHRVGVVVMDELLYAVGGSAGSEYHNTVEFFDPEEDRWCLVQPMHSKRLGVGVAVVNRLLYAIGGFDGVNRLATVECYHPENNAWTSLPSMAIGRSGAGVAALNQYIYVVGGFDGQAQLSSVERYDTELQIWEMVAEIRIARSALSLTVLDGKLYAMGGFDGQQFLAIVEVYDPVRNSWEEGTPLTSGRSGHASAVIYQPCGMNALGEGVESCSSRENDSETRDETPQAPPTNGPSSGCGGRDRGFCGGGGGGGSSRGGENCSEEEPPSPTGRRNSRVIYTTRDCNLIRSMWANIHQVSGERIKSLAGPSSNRIEPEVRQPEEGSSSCQRESTTKVQERAENEEDGPSEKLPEDSKNPFVFSASSSKAQETKVTNNVVLGASAGKLLDNPKKCRRKCATSLQQNFYLNYRLRVMRAYYDMVKRNINSIVRLSSRNVNSLRLKSGRCRVLAERRRIQETHNKDTR
ncbi:kelch-like ECH-associated protein 1B isoform X2 [Phlebotomus papatasi]|nr:kelch-like ECH-associated protein 1B isoform X2 [Phlebotomus papatasi]XP_055698575.1 kelch-like ECH-associated protein 1B isoform X2 [Phlebotomus papatasi]